MNNKNNRLVIGIALLFEITLIVTAILSIVSRQWKNLWLSLLAVVCLIIPFILTRIANIKKIRLPYNFQLMTLIFIFLAQYLGEIKNFYGIFWWWDILLHATSGSYVVIIALYSMEGVITKEEGITNQRFDFFTAIFAFSISITLGTLWEMFEFIGDYLFKTNMVKGGLEDTSTDLIVKILAAFITSIIYYYKNNISIKKRSKL